ncbi:Dephospho-CoA kinase [Shewanella denitrificans OS217]|uniref:Dephospho-CoA kinase n=1 Tax=Shewanella denitrificans (strain OS217 / ATCC BAA-1090 / DSM 15013) TaxID=318161 RepID=Q12IQ8_SHEDO|nr:dephospho-CoA kinase [Shewanella denitrificans]ABE56668.1 Dephospho-CoA kinase [Shewanella denitrificans OS217]
MEHKFIVGLTGGIGSGKTTVSDMFNQHGITIVDADLVAREVVAPESTGLKAIVSHFGERVLQADGQLDRAKLRIEIFDQPEQREWLNNLLHPMIRQLMFSQIEQAQSAYVILVAPLLFENELDKLVNSTLAVDISPQLQVSRTSSRDNVEPEQVQKIIASQISRELRLEKANKIIENTGDFDYLRQAVAKLHQEYLRQAQVTQGER